MFINEPRFNNEKEFKEYKFGMGVKMDIMNMRERLAKLNDPRTLNADMLRGFYEQMFCYTPMLHALIDHENGLKKEKIDFGGTIRETKKIDMVIKTIFLHDEKKIKKYIKEQIRGFKENNIPQITYSEVRGLRKLYR